MSSNSPNRINTLKKLYRDKSGKSKLSKFVGAMTIDQLESLVNENLISSDGADILDGLFLGLSESANVTESQNKRFKIIELVLKKLQSSETPPILAQSLLTSVQLELPLHTSENIVKIVEECVDTIRKGSDAHTSWKDLIPECLRLLSSRGGNVNHYDTSMATSQFVKRAIHSLCQVKWTDSVVIPLAAMFNEIQLSKEEHLEIVNKLCCDLDTFNPDSLPPLIHQLLRFCKDQNAPLVYFRINDYFFSRLYKSMKDTNPQDSESPIAVFDSIEDYSNEDVQKAEATCIYYACRGGNAFKKFLTTIKTLTKRPASLLMAPTILQILLASDQQKELCIQIIRSALNNYYFEELRRSNFTWCKDILSADINVKSVMNTLIENSLQYCHITGEGLLMLAMSLISTGGLFPTAVKLQELGLYLLTKLLKKKPEAMQLALKMIKDKLAAESISIQYVAESLKLLCISMPHSVMEYTVILQGILEDCLVLPDGRNWTEHKMIVEAMNTVIRLDSRLRDTLVMICRKGLFSRDPRIGKISVHGFLSIIKTLNTTPESFSQEHCSAYSVLSQISLNVYSVNSGSSSRVNNGTVCMEVVSLLRRCFSQNFDVREQLYLGLPSAIRKKPELLEPVLNILYEHLTSHYYVSDIEALPPLSLERCATLKDNITPTLLEPLGRLLFIVQKLLVCEQPPPGGEAPGGWSLSGDPEKFTGIAGKLYVILLSLANRMSKCTTIHFNLDDGVSLHDIDIDSQFKCLILSQALSCYEALIAFRINEWTPTKTDQAQKLLNLQKNYNQLLDYSKSSNTKNKKEAPIKKTQKTQSSQKNKENETINDEDEEPVPKKKAKTKKTVTKLSDLAKSAKVGFKPPLTVWDSYSFSRSLELLYGKSVKWATMDQLNGIRNKRELHRIIIKFGIGVSAGYKSGKLPRYEESLLSKCAMFLYDGCLHRLDDFSDFDSETAILAVDCFHDILKIIINNVPTHLSEFLSVTANIEETKPLAEKISLISEHLTVQLEMLIASIPLTDDVSMHKIIPILFHLITTLLHQLPGDIDICQNWVNRLETFASQSSTTVNPLGASVTSALLDIIAKTADPWPKCNLIAKKLANIMDTSENAEPLDEAGFEILTASTAPVAFVGLCSHINTRLSAVETVVARIRGSHMYMSYRKADQVITAQASLGARERSVCAELWQAAMVARQLAVVTCPAGQCCDSIIHLISRLHSVLATLTSHFLSRDQRAVQSARFDKLVKVCGKQMSEAMDSLIAHVEAARTGTTNVKANAQRALKDTKHIPRLVYNSELFYKRVHQLSSKLKIDLVQYLSKGNARDFKIKAAAFKDTAPQPEDLADADDVISIATETDNREDAGTVSDQATTDDDGEVSD